MAPSHGHGHGHGHEHSPGHGHRGRRQLLAPHSHDAADQLDDTLTASRVGMRALWGSFAVLLGTAAIQAAVVVSTGSVALLSDTLHNLADACTAVPLAVAFRLGRRATTRRFTYGYGRTEDFAGLLVLTVVAASSVLAFVESVRRFVSPEQLHQLPALAAAAVFGFAGNEIAARWRISTGRRIGSAALIADGVHARTDGFTSLAVLVAAGGAAIGWRWVDPVVGLVVAVAIAVVLVGAGRPVLARLLDAADPELVARADRLAGETPGVLAVEDVRLRWSGRDQLAELTVVVDRDLSLVDAHHIAHDVEHRLLHALPKLLRAHVHPHPAGADHVVVAHHRHAGQV